MQQVRAQLLRQAEFDLHGHALEAALELGKRVGEFHRPLARGRHLVIDLVEALGQLFVLVGQAAELRRDDPLLSLGLLERRVRLSLAPHADDFLPCFHAPFQRRDGLRRQIVPLGEQLVFGVVALAFVGATRDLLDKRLTSRGKQHSSGGGQLPRFVRWGRRRLRLDLLQLLVRGEDFLGDAFQTPLVATLRLRLESRQLGLRLA